MNGNKRENLPNKERKVFLYASARGAYNRKKGAARSMLLRPLPGRFVCGALADVEEKGGTGVILCRY